MFAAARMYFHPRHVAVALLGNPLMKVRRRVRNRIRMRDPDDVEAFLARPRDQLGFDGLGIFQKSRLA